MKTNISTFLCNNYWNVVIIHSRTSRLNLSFLCSSRTIGFSWLCKLKSYNTLLSESVENRRVQSQGEYECLVIKIFYNSYGNVVFWLPFHRDSKLLTKKVADISSNFWKNLDSTEIHYQACQSQLSFPFCIYIRYL